MINTLIVDDEIHCIDRLLHLIERRPDTFNVVCTCQSVETALDALEKNQVDLVFLDIEIKDKTGFDFLRKVENVQFHTIFTTAFDTYAIKALKYNAFDYLLKPIDIDEFNETIVRLNKRLGNSQQHHHVQNLISDIETKNHTLLTISSVEGFETVPIVDIVHLKADGNYTYIYTKEKKSVASKPIKYYEDLLDKKDFIRCHKSHIINITNVKKYHKGNQAWITMMNGEKVPIAARRKEDFLSRFVL